jgi:hypothetical protein
MQSSMKFAARTIIAGSIVIFAAGCVTPPPAQAQVTFQTERAEHPNMARAVDQMVAAYADMERAPSDFGGQKGQAMQALHTAIVAAKRALYFRMHMDDNALWRSP